MGTEVLCVKLSSSHHLAKTKADSLIDSIEMNVIIIAACIPTLRPIFLILFKLPGADNFRASVRERGHSSYYYRTADSDGSKKTTVSRATGKAFDKRTSRAMTESAEAINTKDSIDGGGVIQVESREVGSQERETEEGEWGHANGTGVPMTNIGSCRSTVGSDSDRLGEDTLV